MNGHRLFRVYLPAIRRNKAIVAMLFAGLMLFGAVLATFQALWARNHSIAASVREDAMWAAYQTDREVVRLGEALHGASHRPVDAPVDDILLRFDILFSRHVVMEEADLASKFRNDPRLIEPSRAVGETVRRMTPVFDRMAARGRATPDEIAAMVDETKALRLSTETLLTQTHHVLADLKALDRAETMRIQEVLAGAIAAMTFALGTVIVLIWRQLRQLDAARLRLQRLSEELAQSAAEAEAGNRAKTTFLATMSHEIRTPLNGIVGMSELLAGGRLDTEQADQLRMIRQCSDGLVGLIDDILDYSKFESGKVDLECRPTDLGDIVEGVVEMLSPRAEAKGVAIVAAHPMSRYLTDPTRLRQVLVNLVGNAVKFTDSGAVAIRVFEIGRRDGACTLRFLVEDTGIGISAENQKRLFQEFTQADASIGRRFGSRSRGGSSTPWAATSGWRAARGAAPRSASRFRSSGSARATSKCRPCPSRSGSRPTSRSSSGRSDVSSRSSPVAAPRFPRPAGGGSPSSTCRPGSGSAARTVATGARRSWCSVTARGPSRAKSPTSSKGL
jgi:signal transduction histidine kinase